MIQKHEIFANYHPGFYRAGKIDTITIHGSGGGLTAEALFKWWKNLPTAEDEWSKKKVENMKNGIGFYHFLIDREGKVYSMLEQSRWSYHAHSGQADKSTIAVCLVNPDNKNGAEYTEMQYFALYELCNNLVAKYPTIINVDGHTIRAKRFSNMVAPTPCPGPLFDWSRMAPLGIKIWQ